MPYTLSQLKEVLDGLGYNLGPDGLNGNNGNSLDVFTQAAIRELQAQYQLPTSGKLDTTTDNLVRKLVRTTQYGLNLVMDAKLPVNEFYGPRTVQAIKAFQRTYGLPVTGIAGFTVRQKLEEEARKRAIASA
ncbi:MAG: peptidoglycan-binding protein [Oscillatoriales cyanobacterium C42_A2020_001]|nr:peptidoglycan-binding protein [Leptolyngbyaceae cyanobacterium C42_A2020_001]